MQNALKTVLLDRIGMVIRDMNDDDIVAVQLLRQTRGWEYPFVHPIGTIGTVAELKEEHKGFDYPV
jgi:hypothetical protein